MNNEIMRRYDCDLLLNLTVLDKSVSLNLTEYATEMYNHAI